MKSYEESFKA